MSQLKDDIKMADIDHLDMNAWCNECKFKT